MLAEHPYIRNRVRAHQLTCSRSFPPFPAYEPSRPVDRASIFIRSLRGLQAAPTVARCCRLFHGVAGYNDSQYGRSRYLFRPRRRSPQHEGGAGELYAQPGGLHPDQWLDGGPVRNPPCIRIGDWYIHPRVLSVRNIKQHPLAGRLSHPARLRRRDDGASGPAHPGANICQVRSSARDELCFHTSPGGAHARTHRRRSHRRVSSLARHFLP